ncbi:MAG: sulfotransferase [Bacteroidales bacterium]
MIGSKIYSIIRSPLPCYKIILVLVFRALLLILYGLGKLFDGLFYSKANKVRIKNPVFLIGHPRSGTTFIHRFLIDFQADFRGMLLWEMILPYISLRKLLKKRIEYFNMAGRKNLYNPDIHKTGLKEAETDDVALFFKSFEGLFFWLYFRAFNHFKNAEELELDLIQNIQVKKSLLYLKKVHSRNLLQSNNFDNRAFSKSFSLIMDIEEIFQIFPDSKIILLIRNPMEVIPSSISLISGLMDKLYAFKKMDPDLQKRFYENIYQASVLFYKSLDKVLTNNIEFKDKMILINYPEIKNNFSATMFKLIDFLSINKTVDMMEKISSQEITQKAYSSRHSYHLSDFGFDEERIKKDFDFIYQKYKI